MRLLPEKPASLLHRPALVITLAWFAAACATSGTTDRQATEVRDESGFTITEDLGLSGSVRGDFEDALRALEQEEYERGIALMGEVTEAAPHATTAHINLGIAYGRVDDLEKAEASFERALELNSRHPVAHNELAMILRRSGRFEEARTSYESALAAHPKFHFARRNLAILCDVYLVDPACALEHYEIYVEAVPEDEVAAMWIADLRTRAGR